MPLAAGVLGIAYLSLLAPVFGYALLAWLTLAAALISAGAGFVLRYPRDFARAEEQLLHRQVEQRQEREHEELRRLRDALKVGFAAAAAPDGLRTLEQLTNEFEQVQPALRRRRDAEPLSMALVPALTVATYRRGLSVLVDALDLADATHTSGVERLRREVATLEREVESMRSDPAQAERLRLKEDGLSSYRERLGMLDELQLRKDQLLFQAQRCEASLYRTRIDLTAIRTGSGESSVDSVIEALRRTIDQAKAVQAEISRLGY